MASGGILQHSGETEKALRGEPKSLVCSIIVIFQLNNGKLGINLGRFCLLMVLLLLLGLLDGIIGSTVGLGVAVAIVGSSV